MNFGQALERLKDGDRLTRAGWNGEGMFVYLVPAASYPAQTEAARKSFGEVVDYRAYFALSTSQGVATWQPSPGDVLAEDWYAV